MRDRLPLILSATALLISVFGATSLGQAAYTAVVPKNSVGPDQIRNAAVTNAKLRGDAVTSGKVLNGSLRMIDFKAGQLPAGPKGDKGEKGERGEKGAKGDKGDKGVPGISGYNVIQGQTRSTTNAFQAVSATCPTGSRPVGGGGFTQTPGAGVTVRNSFPVNNGWGIVVDAKTPTPAWNYIPYVICVTVST
jgi:Collagen triple helix repeat (20 copies)